MGLEERRQRTELTRATIDAHLEAAGAESGLSSTLEMIHYVFVKEVIGLVVKTGTDTVELHRRYEDLPESARELVEKLKGIGYKVFD